MARIGRFERFIQDTAGNGVGSVNVEIRKQGATVNGDQSGTSPLTITVNDPGAITSSDNVVVGTGTTTHAVDSVTTTTVVVSGFGGTLAVSDDDRLSPTTNLPSLFNDALSVEALTNPLVSAVSTGLAIGWVRGGFYDIHVSGGSPTAVTTVLQEDTFVMGEDNVSRAFDSATQDGWIWDSAALTTAGAAHTSFKVNGTEIFRIDKDGDLETITGVFNSTIANSGTNIAFDFNSLNTLSGTTKLLRVTNNTVEKFLMEDDGAWTSQGGGTLAAGNLAIDGSTAKVVFETDTNLYRSAANTLKTDDSLLVGASLKVNGFVRISDTATAIVISGGIITVVIGNTIVDTEGAAASDDLDTINGGTSGALLVLSAENVARTVVCKDGTGNLQLAGDFSLDHTNDRLLLVSDGSNWTELSRSNNAA